MRSLKEHTRRHSLFYTISIILLVFLAIAAALNYHSIISTRKMFYTSTLESQSLSELSMFQESSNTLVRQYFQDALGTITNLATNQTIQQQLRANQSAALVTILNQQRTISGQFDSFSLISAAGGMVAFSGNTTPVPPGTDEAQSPAFLAGKTAAGAVLISAHQSQLNRVVFSIVAPVIDKTGHFLGTASGAITLVNVAQHIHLSSKYDSAFSALVTDADGNALSWKNDAVQGLMNEKDNEPTLKSLMTRQSTVPANQEYNFAKTNSFAMGDTVDFGASGKLYLVSFYDIGQYQRRINEGMQDITNTFAGFIVRDGLLFLCTLAVIAVVIKVHESRNV